MSASIILTPANRKAWAALALIPETLPDLLDHLRTGGTLTDWAAAHGVALPLVVRWLNEDPDRRAAYEAVGIEQNDAWARRIIDEVQRLALLDVRGLFDEAGNVLPPEDWPPALAAAVVGLEVKETVEPGRVDRDESPDGEPLQTTTGRVVKLKMVDKLKALEMLGRELGRFTERKEVKHTFDLADGLKKARARARVYDAAPAATEGAGGGILAAGPPAPPTQTKIFDASNGEEVSPSPGPVEPPPFTDLEL